MASSHSPRDSATLLFLLTGVLVVPELTHDLAGAGEPFLVAPEQLQGFGRVMFYAVARGVAERFEQPRAGQHRNIVGFETQKPRRFKHIEARGENLPAQEFNLFFVDIHAVILLGGNSVRCI